MGILAGPLDFVRTLGLPPGFSVCELGDQYVTSDIKGPYLAEEFYRGLGCRKYVSIDGNGRGNVTADLNLPLQPEVGRFDLVTDFGTGEHVFNQCQVFKTIHYLMKKGGHFVFDRPCAGYDGHCFYLIQWNLITALAHANDYRILHLEEQGTTRGRLLRGVMLKRTDKQFVTPQQGRYYKDLVIDPRFERKGPDHKSQELRKAGYVGKQRKEPPSSAEADDREHYGENF